jgi:hypothetical protein
MHKTVSWGNGTVTRSISVEQTYGSKDLLPQEVDFIAMLYRTDTILKEIRPHGLLFDAVKPYLLAHEVRILQRIGQISEIDYERKTVTVYREMIR